MTVAEIDLGPPPPCPARFNLAAHTLAAAGSVPDKTALEVIGGEDAGSRSFADLDRAVRGAMTGLAEAGVARGDRVLLRLAHSIDFPILFLALAGMGALPVPTSPQITQEEVDAIAADLSPRLTLASPGLACPAGPVIDGLALAALRDRPPADWADTGAEDPAFVIYTSGTGGVPKGVVHAHRAGWARRMMWQDWYGLRNTDRLLHAGAFNWTFTLGTGLLDPWAAGATALIYAGERRPGVWPELIARHRATLFAAAPGIYRQLLATTPRAELPTLRHGLTAGEAMPARTRAAWEQATGRPVFEALGMSEVSTYLSERPGTRGLAPQRGRHVAVLDMDAPVPAPRGTLGRLAVSGKDPGLMLGYWAGEGRAPDLPLSAGWFLTGDLAVMDADGIVTHEGRLDDLVNAQGIRVSAAEIERVLAAHPGVAECAVVSLRVRADVSILAAFVVRHDHADVTADALASHCAGHLARYKCPREIRLVPALPRTPTGKVLKRRIMVEHGWTEDA